MQQPPRPPTDPKASATVKRSYEDFDPSSNWVRDEEHDTLVVLLPGFKKEQVRVQIESRGNLKVSGERPLEENRWSRFRKDFRIPKGTNASEIHAKFVGGLLYVITPKSITGVTTQDQATPSQPPPPTQKPAQSENNRIEQAKRINEASKKENNRGNLIGDAKKDVSAVIKKPAAGDSGGTAGKVIRSMENVVSTGFKPTSYECGVGGSSLRLSKCRIVSIAVAIAVMVALGVYAA